MAEPLHKLFEDIQKNSSHYLNANNGSAFEDLLAIKFDKMGYTRILPGNLNPDDLKKIKRFVNDKYSDKYIPNPTDYKEHFLKHPSGGQDYPDFWLFSNNRIFAIEAKFSTKSQKKPVWNSGLPRPNGVYVFASYEARDITFFLGGDVVSVEEARQFHDFFQEIKEREDEFNKSKGGQKFGFSAYIRKAFDQKKTFNKDATINYFTNPRRPSFEKAVIDFFRTEAKGA